MVLLLSELGLIGLEDFRIRIMQVLYESMFLCIDKLILLGAMNPADIKIYLRIAT